MELRAEHDDDQAAVRRLQLETFGDHGHVVAELVAASATPDRWAKG